MPTQVFTRRSVKIKPVTKVVLWLFLAGVALIGWRLYSLFPPAVWQRAVASTLEKGFASLPLKWLELLAGLAASLGILWVQWKQERSARLQLDEHWLRLDSGVPLLRRWLDWRLSLDDVRSGRTPLRLNGMAIGSQALWIFRVGWGLSGLRQFQPAAWIPDTESNGADLLQPFASGGERPPHRPLGYVHWGHPDNAVWLQQRFDALPLVRALRQQGIELPPLARAPSNRAGVDLLRYRRLRISLKWVLPSGLVLGAVLQHLARHQHYFSPWSMSGWVAIALSIALLTGVWLWRDTPAKGMHRGDEWSVRMAQGLVAVLVAVVVPWGLQATPLVLANWFVAPHSVDFVLNRDRDRLVPESGASISKSILIDAAAPFWTAQGREVLQPLPVRSGLGGLWQQYDAEELNGRIADFLEQQQRTQHPALRDRKTDS